MNRLHVITGLSTLAVFLVTGLFMLQGLNLPAQDMDAQRMMYRASHIYLLFIACTNIVAGVYFEKTVLPELINLQRFSSVSLVIAQPVLLAAFIIEPAAIDNDRLITLTGCVLTLVGVLVAVLTKALLLRASGSQKAT